MKLPTSALKVIQSIQLPFLIGALIGSFYSTSFAQEQQNVRDSETQLRFTVGDPKRGPEFAMDIVIPKSSKEELRQNYLRQQAQSAQAWDAMKSMCNGRETTAKSFAFEFLTENGALTTVYGLSAFEQANGDPAKYRHFVEQSILDPLAHVSFLGFMLANRATIHMLSLIGLNHDPCLLIKKINRGSSRVHDLKPTKLQSRFAALVGPIGMSGGLLASSMLHEILADPWVRMCARGLIEKMDPTKRKEACDKAQEQFVISGKIYRYMPDVISMFFTSWIQGYGVNQFLFGYVGGKTAQVGSNLAKSTALSTAIKTAEKRALQEVVLKGMRVSINVGSRLVPTGLTARLLTTFVNMYVFINLNELILPWVAEPYFRFTKGFGTTSLLHSTLSEISRAEKQGWKWSQKKECQQSKDDWLYKAYTNPVNPSDCFTSSKPPAMLIRELGARYRDWREHYLQDAVMEHQNWADYVSNFTNMYSSSYNFYQIFARELQLQKKQDSLSPGSSPRSLFAAEPFHGLNLTVPENICEISADDKSKITKAKLDLENEIRIETARGGQKRHPMFLAWMRTIHLGFEATDCSLPFAPSTEFIKKVRSNPRASLSREQAIEVDIRLRKQYFVSGLKAIREALQYSLGSIKADSVDITAPRFVELSKNDIFRRLVIYLGNAEPLPAGVAQLRRTEVSDGIFVQELRHLHPDSIGLASTPLMTDYLVASMVCGPDADPSRRIKVQIARESTRRSTFDKVLAFFGMAPKESSKLTADDEMIDIIYNSMANPDPDQKTNASNFKTDVTLIPKKRSWSIDFRPPRIVGTPFNGTNFCQSPPRNFNPRDFTFNIHEGQWKAPGKTYNGFLDLIRQEVRPDIINANENRILEWWESKVDPHVSQAIDLMRDNYEKILLEKFVPKINSQDVKEFNNYKFHLGTAGSLKAELRFYINLIKRTYLDEKESGDKETVEWIDEYWKWLDSFERQFHLSIGLFQNIPTLQRSVLEIETDKTASERERLAMVDDLKGLQKYGSKRTAAAWDKNRNNLETMSQGLTQMLEQEKAADANAKSHHKHDIRAAAVANIREMMAELDSYFGYFNALRLDELRDPGETN